MEAQLFRTRVAVLWVAVGVAAVGSLLLYLFVPGALEEMQAGQMEGETLSDAMGFFFTAVGALPLVMAGVSLLVGDRVNLWANLIAGLLYGAFGTFAVVSHLSAGDLNGHVLLAGLAGLLAYLIAGIGVIGLRHPASQAVTPVADRELPRQKVRA